MRAIARACLIAGVLLAAFSGPAAQASEGRLVSISFSQRLPVMRPDTPVPDDPGQVFYLQRSTNRNTIVYAARFDGDGNLDPRDPLAVYWRRFEEEGQIQALNFEQRVFAFGVRVRPGAQPGEFDVRFRAMAGTEATLRQIGPFRAELIGRVGQEAMRLKYGFIEAIDGFIPRVIEVRIFGRHENGSIVTAILQPR